MPATLNYPGVYIEELPSGVRTITGVATSITAFVGYTTRGEVNRARRVNNYGEFERAFGGLDRTSELGYAVQQFFQNGGNDAYVVRVADGAAPASIELRYDTTHTALEAAAASSGAWGNYVRLDVDYATSNPDSTFNLTATRFERQADGALKVAETERFQNLSMNSRSATYAPNVASGSNLIRLTRPEGLTFTGRGYSQSGNLSTFPNNLGENDRQISGVLNGTIPFTLALTGALPTSLAETVAALNTAIQAAALKDYLEASLTDAEGTANTGSFLKLTSNAPSSNPNPNSAPEFSAVRVVAGTGLSAKLKLGLENGGREKDGASTRRPLPTGTTGASLAGATGTLGGDMDVTVTDHSLSTTGTQICQVVGLTVPDTAVGPALATALQTVLGGSSNPAAVKGATVTFTGGTLRVVPSADTPNAGISFAGAGAVALKLTTGVVNVQQYSLGTGAAFAAQTTPKVGSDGNPPKVENVLGSEADKTGMYALLDVDLFNLLAIPRTAQMTDTEASAVLSAAIALCQDRRAFYLIDPPKTVDGKPVDRTNIATWMGLTTSRNAAVFFPSIVAADPLDGFRPRAMPASGAVAGVFARTDTQRGVWKAPAGTDANLTGVLGLSYTLTDQQNGALNVAGVNALRTFPVYGTVVWGARTRRGDDASGDDYKYTPVRRLALFLEESLFRATQWVVFEPNDEPLWSQIRLNIGAFLHGLFRQGAFQGKTPREAYFVKCDKETTTQTDINRGVVNILVGFAPLKPAEFVVIQLQQMAGQITT